MHRLRGWMDHLYVLRGSGTQYVSEPYHLEEDALRELVALADAGWHVDIEGRLAVHYPAETFRVVLSRPLGQRGPAPWAALREAP